MPWFGYDSLLPQSRLSADIMEGKLKILETNQKPEGIRSLHVYLPFCAFRDIYCDVVKGEKSMFGWGALKHSRVPKSVRFCINLI